MPRFCSNCGSQIPDAATTCPSCNKAVSVGGGAAAAPASSPAVDTSLVGMRIVSFIVDMVPAAIVIFIISFILALIPIIGLIANLFLMPLMYCAYALCRDLILSGSSIGKHFLHFKVLSKDGSPATTKQKIMRNLDLAIPSAVQVIPVLGWVLGGLLALCILVTEVIFLFTKGERLGDQWAGTKVIKTQ